MKKSWYIFIVVILIISVILIVNMNKSKNKEGNSIKNETVENNTIAQEESKQENDGLLVEGHILKDEKNNKNVIVFKVQNNSVETIESKDIECILYDGNKNEVTRKNIHIDNLKSNGVIDGELELESEYSNSSSIEFTK